MLFFEIDVLFPNNCMYYVRRYISGFQCMYKVDTWVQNDAIFSTAAISGLSVNQRLHFQSLLFVLCCSSFGLFPISSLSFVTNARMLLGLWCGNTVLRQESISYWWVTCEKKSISLLCIILWQCTWRHQGMTRINFDV